jgi:hypothetical protein
LILTSSKCKIKISLIKKHNPKNSYSPVYSVKNQYYQMGFAGEYEEDHSETPMCVYCCIVATLMAFLVTILTLLCHFRCGSSTAQRIR